MRCERLVQLAMAHPGTDLEDLLHRTLTDQFMVVITLGNHHGHAPALEVEGDLVDLAIVVGRIQLLMDIQVLQHRHVEQVFQARLVISRTLRGRLGRSAQRPPLAVTNDLRDRERVAAQQALGWPLPGADGRLSEPSTSFHLNGTS